MKIGVWIPDKYLTSVRIYYQQLKVRLESEGFELVPFGQNDTLPEDVDIYWDPTCTGGKSPNRRFIKATKPLVATVHGAANFSLPLKFTFDTPKKKLKGFFLNTKRKFFWNFFRKNIGHIITVSAFAKEEIVTFLNLSPEKISVIHHGYDSNNFNDGGIENRSFLLHVSVYQPIKNIQVMLDAYQLIPENERLPLVMIVPGYPGTIEIPGVELHSSSVPPSVIAEKMKAAKAFILPSFRESFGLPVIEAMACGTPVITSLGSACEEVAGSAGILCDPRDTKAWKDAIQLLSTDENQWMDYHKRVLLRAKDFCWDACAAKHIQVFRKTLDIDKE
jgi:glycosyltransferase involved in cell wall biosynthesis